MYQKIIPFALLLLLLGISRSFAQDNKPYQHLQGRYLPADTMVKTQHQATIQGKNISYTAIAGTQPVYAKDGHIIASLFYVYYKRDGIEDRSKRPLMI